MLLTMSKTSRLPAHSEHELVAAIRAGNDHAFEELYSRYRERIFSFILSKVHDHGRAEDIAQEVFMSALRRLRSSDQMIAFKPWIYEIAKNACIDEFRRGSRAHEVPLESDGEFIVDRQKSSVSLVPTPAAAVESKQRLNDLRGAFGGLSSTHHQLLVMREFEGMSYDEIGERLDMTRQMVESSLFRARRKLSEEYQELASGQRCEQIQTAIESGRLRVVSALGLRDRRRFARHLAHCQPCRHTAQMAGVDETLLKPRSIAAKIAALLPFPLLRLPWRSKAAHSSAGRAGRAGGTHFAGASPAGLVPSAGGAFTLGQAAATVAVIVAGAGGGLAVSGLASGANGHHSAATRSTRQVSSASGSSGTASSAAAKASHRRASLTTAHAAVISTGSRAASARPTSRRNRHASAPGAPGSGSGGGSGSPQATGGSSPTASGTTNQVVNGANKTVDGLHQAAAGAGKTVSNVTNGVNQTVNNVTNGVNKTVNNVTNGVSKTVNNVTNTLGNATSTVGSTVSNATNGAVDPSQAVSGVNKVVSGVGNGVAGTGSQTVNGATGTVTSTVQKVVSGVTGTSNTSTQTSGSSTPTPSAPATSSGSNLLGGLVGH